MESGRVKGGVDVVEVKGISLLWSWANASVDTWYKLFRRSLVRVAVYLPSKEKIAWRK